jgi:hypothetical protein
MFVVKGQNVNCICMMTFKNQFFKGYRDRQITGLYKVTVQYSIVSIPLDDFLLKKKIQPEKI